MSVTEAKKMEKPKTEKRVVWGFNGKKWVKRKSVQLVSEPEYPTTCENLTKNVDALKVFCELHGHHHSYFPVGFNPNESQLISKMLKQVEVDCVSYKSDFYRYDIGPLFKYEKHAIWITKICGTQIFNLNEYESEERKLDSVDDFKYWVKVASFKNLFLIEGETMREITPENGLELLNNCPVKKTDNNNLKRPE